MRLKPGGIEATRRCERVQAMLFADLLRKELREMRKAADEAEARGSRRQRADVVAAPPERLERLHGRSSAGFAVVEVDPPAIPGPAELVIAGGALANAVQGGVHSV